MAKEQNTTKYSEYILVNGLFNGATHLHEVQVIKPTYFANIDEMLTDFVYVGRPTLPFIDEYTHRDLCTPKKSG